MRALLYVKGIKEPFHLTGEEGKAAEKLIADSLYPSDTPFSVEGIWTGLKRDMRYVTFEREIEYRENEVKPLTPEEQKRSDQARKETGEWLKKRKIIK